MENNDNANAGAGANNPPAVKLDATVVTAGKECQLGTDPAQFLKRFEEWWEQHDLLADTIGVTEERKLKILFLWGGRDFRKFAKDAGVVTEGGNLDDLGNAIEKIRRRCGSHVNLSMAMFKLMHAKQGSRTFTEFVTHIEELATQCQFDTDPYNKERAMKDALIFGTSDEKLKQEALAKDFNLADLRKSALGYEQSRRSTDTMKAERGQNTEDCRKLYTQEQVEEIVAKLSVAGKYSSQSKVKQDQSKIGTKNEKCIYCPPHYRPHEPQKCPAKGKVCVVCKKKNHFAGSQVCSGTVRNVVHSEASKEEDRYWYESEPIKWIETVNTVNTAKQKKNSDTYANVAVDINRVPMNMFVDSGCKYTLIPCSMYDKKMGPIVNTSMSFRPYGTKQLLSCHGAVSATISTGNGTKHNTTVYIVEGYSAEPLLGNDDAKNLGILVINKDGKKTSRQEEVRLVASDIRASGVTISGDVEKSDELHPDARKRVDKILERHSSLFEGIGLLKGEEVKLNIDPTVTPVSAPYRSIPLAYQERLSEHLQTLREEGKIEDVDPTEYHGWISNTVITEKPGTNQIRMNIDMREPNKAIKRTKQHVETIQEIRHKLKGATVFSELDMRHGYHQIGLDKASRHISTFQSHEGLHRFLVLFFGASSATDLFHQRIKGALYGLNGVLSIHDNILVYGKDQQEHDESLEALLQRLEECGLTLRREKCNFGKTSVTWFGYIFSKSGISADPVKIKSILQAGRPENAAEVKSFLQACQFNARFMYESDQAYAQLTAPLRKLTCKNARFMWTTECEDAYQQIAKDLTSEKALKPFDPKLRTKFIADASPVGVSASIYQEHSPEVWHPVDHVSRSLTSTEQGYAAIEKESLALTWGMNMFRYYLLGIEFDSYTDHTPLLNIFGGRKKGNARVERLRVKVQGFSYDIKYIPGKENPTDYSSRHPTPLAEYTQSELDSMVIDEDDLCISRIITDDLPDAVTLKMVQMATQKSTVMQRLIKCIQKGYIDDADDLKPYRQIFHELMCTQGIVLKGEKLVIPDEEIAPGCGSLQQQVIDIAHEGHQGDTKTKRLSRAKFWFPGMDSKINQKVSGCLGCQATTSSPTRDPLKPTVLPDRPWQKVDMDFWGPLPSGESLLVMIDEYTRYPIVGIVSGTSARAVIPHIDKVFATHGFPDQVKTDGGPPFNGLESHEYKQYMKWAGVKAIVVSPEDPEANGLAENFMKSMKKIWHISLIEKKNPKQELYKFLRSYRATPHTSTGKAPAELLFGRPYKTRLPQLLSPADNPEVRENDRIAKAKQKTYKDSKNYVRPHNIETGDNVLLLQRMTKTKSRYDPEPYTVIKVQGTQITASRNGKVMVRDSQKFKKVEISSRNIYRKQREQGSLHTDSNDFGFDFPTTPAAAQVRTAENLQDMLEVRVPQPIPPHRHITENQGQYPNRHLEVDVNLERHQRQRRAPQRYVEGK